MARKDKGHYSKKHSSERKINKEIGDALKQNLEEGTLACAVAFKISSDMKVSVSEIGFTADFLEIRITKCQLGLFGYQPKKKIVTPTHDVPVELENLIRGEISENRLACKSAWEIAEKQGIGKMDVSSACEALGLKVSGCQLGAF